MNTSPCCCTYLIEILGLKDNTGDDTLAGGSLDLNIETSEEDELAGGHGGGLAVLGDGEDGALAVILESGAGELAQGTASTLGEVAVDLVLAESRIGLACCLRKTVSCRSHFTVKRGVLDILLCRGLQSVKVWPETREEAARITAAAERDLANIVAVD